MTSWKDFTPEQKAAESASLKAEAEEMWRQLRMSAAPCQCEMGPLCFNNVVEAMLAGTATPDQMLLAVAMIIRETRESQHTEDVISTIKERIAEAAGKGKGRVGHA